MMTPSTRSPSMPMLLAYPTGSFREEFRSRGRLAKKVVGRRTVRCGPEEASRLAAREVDEAAIDVGVDEFDPHAVADVETFEASHEPTLDRWPEDADPGALLGRACYERVEPLADP